MHYANESDVEERLGSAAYVQLTDDENSGSADEEKVLEALYGAEGEVNSHLGRRYAVPVATSGEEELGALLKSVTLDLVEHRLHGRRPPVPEDIRRKRESAVQWLRSVAAGDAVLPAARELAGSAAIGPVGEVRGCERILSREELEDL